MIFNLAPPPPQFLTIVLVEDNTHFANALKRRIEKDCPCRVIAIFNSGNDCISHIHQYDADLLIIDFELPLLSGTETVKQLKDKGFRLPVIFITAFHFPEYIEAAAQLENTTCVLKQNISQICVVIDELTGRTKQNIILTEEELLLIRFICDELDNITIAYRLNVSEETIKKRKQQLGKKIGIENNTISMLKWAIKNNLYSVNR
jgi:two-component system response regulator DesR